MIDPQVPRRELGLGLRGKAGGGARVTAGPKRPHLSSAGITALGREGLRTWASVYSQLPSKP